MGLISGLGRSPGGGNGNPLQYSWLENPLDRGAWRATVHEVTKSRTQLNTRACTFHVYNGYPTKYILNIKRLEKSLLNERMRKKKNENFYCVTFLSFFDLTSRLATAVKVLSPNHWTAKGFPLACIP